MVASQADFQTVAVSKMNFVCTRKPSISNLSELRLLDGDQLDSASSVSRNSVYKLKLDLMFDDSRSMRSSRLDDTRGSHRTRSIIMYGRSELASTGKTSRSISSFLQESSDSANVLAEVAKNDVQRISNSVQAQIEQLFTDVAKDATSSFQVTCLGSIPLKDKVTSLQGLQEPLRNLCLSESSSEQLDKGLLDICATGLCVKLSYKNQTHPYRSKKVSRNKSEAHITPFHNIAVWSAVKLVISEEDGGAAFLPLITDPQNIDKTALFQPLSDSDQQLMAICMQAPIFAVVMRAADTPKVLECHGFICKSNEDAIVIAATLYQSLMAHVSTNSRRSTKRHTPRNENGVSCVSIASSSAVTSSNYLTRSQMSPSITCRKSPFHGNNVSCVSTIPTTIRSMRKKRVSGSSHSSTSNVKSENGVTSTEERKRKSHKTKRAPPVPTSMTGSRYKTNSDIISNNNRMNSHSHSSSRKSLECTYNTPIIQHVDAGTTALTTVSANNAGGLRGESNGDILTRVAIPRSGSFLNTGGLTRYKSRAARRQSGKLGGGGGSPLGFSELFNEFRLHENLHSLDEILYSIIDADGMSFNDLKPIYKEFLLKLAVTLTQDELFQRSKNIMRRQKKKNQKRKSKQPGSQKNTKSALFGANGLKKVFQLGHFRSCCEKRPKPTQNKEIERNRKVGTPVIMGQPTNPRHTQQVQQQHRNRVATSGSDVSVLRHDNASHGQNRNSSSGYVSCSECSYDSESCTCTTADRCYCSLRNEQLNNKLLRKNNHNTTISKKMNTHESLENNSNSNKVNRQSLISCKSDDKCYCSMVEEEPNTTVEDTSVNTNSDTTWCDTDSCASTSKCYCKRTGLARSAPFAGSPLQQGINKKKTTEKLGLDYELFTIGGNSKSVQPHEALSVKKSVEAAAVFADMKLSQTTDIKSLYQSNSGNSQINHTEITNGSFRSNTRKTSTHMIRNSLMMDRDNEFNSVKAMPSNATKKSCSADDLLTSVDALSSASTRIRKGSYHSKCIGSTSLEDSLGYLP